MDDPGALVAAAQHSDRRSDEGEYASIKATATESQTLSFGPLFNPSVRDDDIIPVAQTEGPAAATAAGVQTNVERKERLRRQLRALVASVSTTFGVDHKWIHATLNQRCGETVATAALLELEARRRIAAGWLARRQYDGINL